MKLFVYRTVVVALLLFVIGGSNAVFAIDEVYAARPISGEKLRKDSFSVAIDTVYFDPSLKPLQTTRSVRNLLTLRLDEASLKKLPDNFTVTVELKAYFKKALGASTVLDSTGVLYLQVRHNANGEYEYKALQTFMNGHECKVVIRNITTDLPNISAVESALVLENEIVISREYTFSYLGNAIQAVSFDDSQITQTGELKVSWGNDRAADEYDLEWTYVDDSALQDYQYPGSGAFNGNAIFLRNASRVSISGANYELPLLYDTKGRLFYRVRAVQIKADGQRVEAAWSSDYTAGLGIFSYDGHDPNLNWQATTSFAEEGKRKSVVQYFDGSLRNRQTVTKDNTTNTAIIAETFYDYQGRPAIQVLPAPSSNTIIKYTHAFNKGINGAEYEKGLYDGLLADETECEMGAQALDSVSGAAQYYSGSNPLVDSGMHRFIPKAKGYPFAETRYTPDGTGRVARQSGVGPEFQIGQKATRYYYGTADQEELDALFGTEVGSNTHYFKNMVRDANDQYSISYVDMLGRTVATALAGDGAGNLVKLPSNRGVNIVKKLLDSTNNIIKGTVIESSKALIVTKKGPHTFSYSLVPDSISVTDCNNVPVCYDCRYDLEITIAGECNIPGQGPIVITRNNIAPDTNCNAIAAFPVVDSTILLDEGSYLITKKLTLNQAAMDYYREVFLRRNTCKTIETFIEEQRTVNVISNCDPTYEACSTRLANYQDFKAEYFSQLGIPEEDKPAHENTVLATYKKLKAECDALNGVLDDSAQIRAAMIRDMTYPYGQYANTSAVDSKSLFYETSLFKWAYQDNTITLKNEAGEPEVIQAHLTPLAFFLSQYKPIWAEAFLVKHPEYNKLLEYEKIKRFVKSWENSFQKTETFAEAVAKGYLNPANFSGLPARPEFAHNPVYADSLINYIGATYRTRLKDSLNTTGKILHSSATINAWSLATIMVACKSNDEPCVASYSNINQAFNLGSACDGEKDIAWKAFRQFYLQERRRVLEYYLNVKNGTPNGIPGMGSHFQHFSTPLPGIETAGLPSTEAEAKTELLKLIEDNCKANAIKWLEDLKPCGLTQQQKELIIPRLIEVCKEGGDAEHLFGATTVKPSSTHPDRSFEQVLKSVLGSNYNSSCNVYLISTPVPHGKMPAKPPVEVITKPDSCQCASIDNFYKNYSNRRNGNETAAQYLQRTTGIQMTSGSLDTLKRVCSGELICNFFVKPIVLPSIFQCGESQEVCADCFTVDSAYTKFKLEFPGIEPSRADTSLSQRTNNALFKKHMDQSLGFSKTVIEYLDFINTCNTSGKRCEALTKLRMDYDIIDKFDSTRFVGYPDTYTPYKLRDVYYKGYAHIADTYVNTSGVARRYGKKDTICVGNEFTIVTRIKRPARDTVNTPVDLQISFNQNGHVQQIVPLFYMLKKNATSADSAFVKANSGKIGYLATADTTGQVLQKIPDFTDWKIIKIKHSADNYWRVYYNDTLIAERRLDSSVRRLLEFNVGFAGEANNGYVDYFKIYDAANVLQYTEEFEDHIQSPTNAPLAFRCEDKCREGFVRHFNNRMGTQYDYAGIENHYQTNGCVLIPPCGDTEINRLIDVRNTFKNDYYNYGEIRDVDGYNTRLWLTEIPAVTGQPPAKYRYRDLVKNGVFQAPDTLNTGTLGNTTKYGPYRDSICTNGNFAIEMRVRFDGGSFVQHIYFRDGDTQQSVYSEMGANLTFCWIDYLDYSTGVARSLGGASNVVELNNLNFADWTTIKWKFENYQIKLYFNDVLAKTVNCTSEARFNKLTGWGFGARSNNKVMPMAFDWVKYYDANGNVFFQEDFDDPKNFAKYPDSVLCSRLPCDQEFVKYYNKKSATNLTYSQIAQLYSSKNLILDICEETALAKLCGKPAAQIVPVLPNQHQPCDDSTLFISSASIIRHDIYKDSLLNSFDDRYLAKCLAVAKTESFTVSHEVSEYHYTLYYYDLAGNLVKTVPPAGVDTSKFQWATAWSDSVKTARKNKVYLAPNHALVTDYRYNTLNQVVEQKSPDGGKSQFFYDKLGRLVVSQNAKQKAAVTPGQQDWDYSYTKYDPLGRINEVGQIKNSIGRAPVTQLLTRNQDDLNAWYAALSGRRSQITSTLYDIPYDGLEGDDRLLVKQRNLRNRVSAVSIADGANPTQYSQATFYTYDIHGNVDTLLQDYGHSSFVPNIMNMNGNRFKKIVYEFDLVSGKVNQVKYMPGWADQFYHRYKYDAENRLTLVETSIDGFMWQKDARYEYYLHGPLARTVIGDQSVQGIDYAYTLQGWLKGVNSTGATSTHDMGGDGKAGSLNSNTARDAVGFNLNYFAGDYQPVSSAVAPFPGYSSLLNEKYKPLYNGNISSMASTNRAMENRGNFENGPSLFFRYRYDQLNRLVSMNTDTGFNIASNQYVKLDTIKGFRERVSYDPNGNILTYLRTNKGDEPEMDDLTYTYYPGTNQLNKIGDKVRANKWGVQTWDPVIDIDSQAFARNYIYDEIGNLISDSSEKITNIKWNVYGKIEEITKEATPRNSVTKIRYKYDASGNRIGKILEGGQYGISYTWYVRDAQGNTLNVYTAHGTNSNLAALDLNLEERHIYGSSRLGIETKTQGVDGTLWDAQSYYTAGQLMRGYRRYELTNHLGNVFTVISDKKKAVSSNGSLIDYFEPDIKAGYDYYPFGMPMRQSGEGNYRYGFNGKEDDNEVKGGDGLQIDFGNRIYDSRIGRWLSVDPLQKKFPFFAPYIYVNNNPNVYVDADGRDIIPSAAFLNSPYGLIFSDILKNNSAYLKIVGKYVNSKNFNLHLKYGDDEDKVPRGFSAWTINTIWPGQGPNGDKNPVKVKSKELFEPGKGIVERYTKSHKITDEYSEIKRLSIIVHEGLHSYLGAKREKEDGGHDVFAKQISMIVDVLSEYNTKKNLGYTENQLYELALWGSQESSVYKNYIQGLADKNKTTYELEEGNYNNRVSELTWKEIKREPKIENENDSTKKSQSN